MATDQIVSGIGYGVWALAIVGVGRLTYGLGLERCNSIARDHQWPTRRSKAKAVLDGVLIAAVLGGLASTPSVIREGGDMLYDPGEIVEVIEEPEPVKAFTQTFVFLVGCWSIGCFHASARPRTSH